MKRILSLLIILISFSSIKAQIKNTERAKDIIARTYKEKLKIPFSSIEDFMKNPEKRNDETESTESVVSEDNAAVESEVHAAINPVDSTNMVASANNSSGALSGSLNFIYYTKDFGATWKRSSFKATPLNAGAFNVGGGDPMFAYDKNGRCYFSWISLNGTFSGGEWDLYWAYSDDGGVTWTRNLQHPLIAQSKSVGLQLPTQLYDKQWMACDMSNGPFANNLYCAFFEANSLTGDLFIGLRKKEAASDAFTTSTVRVSDPDFTNLQYCGIDVDNNGIIHVVFYGTKDDITYSVYYSQSTDGGNTFSPNVKISDTHNPRYSVDEPAANITGIDSGRYYPCIHINADKSSGTTSGNLYAVWTANGIQFKEGNGLDIYFSRSTDGGKTWSIPFVVNDDKTVTDQFYPTMDVKKDGGVAVFYYDRRNDPNNNLTDLYGSYSFDGGVTFKPAFKVTNSPSDFRKIGSKNQDFGIGEYIQVVTSPSFAIPFWSDGRTDDGEIDIYSALIPMEKRTEVKTISYIKVNPTLASDFFNIDVFSLEDDKISYQVFDVSGKLMESNSRNILKGETKIEINSKKLSKGTYLVVVNSQKQGKEIKKVIVAK